MAACKSRGKMSKIMSLILIRLCLYLIYLYDIMFTLCLILMMIGIDDDWY